MPPKHLNEEQHRGNVPQDQLGLATLAFVLVTGNDPDGTSIHSADSGSSIGADLSLTPAGPGGGSLALTAGAAATGEAGGSLDLYAGDGNNGATFGSIINLYPGNGGSDHGKVRIYTDDSNGDEGQVLTADAAGFAVWGDIDGGSP